MYKSLIYLVLFSFIVTAKINIEIVESEDKFSVYLINSGSGDVPIAGYRLLANDTTWDSITSEKEFAVINYDEDYALNSMGIWGDIHQLNFTNPQEAVLGAGDTFAVSYFDSELNNIPEIFNTGFGEDVYLSSVILRGYKNKELKELTAYDSMDVYSPEVDFYYPVMYQKNRQSSFFGDVYDTSGVLNIEIYNDSNWENSGFVDLYDDDPFHVDFTIEYDHILNSQNPGWFIAYDSSGNGTVLELRSEVSPIEAYTFNKSSKAKMSSSGKLINLNNLNKKDDLSLEMCDMKGRMIYSNKIELGTESIQIPVNSRCMGSGLYFITLKSNEYNETFKVNLSK